MRQAQCATRFEREAGIRGWRALVWILHWEEILCRAAQEIGGLVSISVLDHSSGDVPALPPRVRAAERSHELASVVLVVRNLEKLHRPPGHGESGSVNGSPGSWQLERPVRKQGCESSSSPANFAAAPFRRNRAE